MSVRDDLVKELEHEIQYFSEHTKNQYRAHVNDFLDYVKRRDASYEKWKERETVYGYIDYLKKRRKVSQQHANYVIRGPVGCLFRLSGLRIPVKLPRVVRGESGEEDNMGWTEEQVAAMVTAARQSDIRTQALMATSTVYAPRISEIVKIEKKDIDFKKMVITIHTVKHNLVRRHIIPEPIQFIICKYDWQPTTEQHLRDVFEAVVAKAGIQRKPRQSVHAFRHSLWTELSYLGYSSQEIYEFTGWSRGGTLGVYLPPLKYNPNNDKKIYEKHPFLKYWE